MAQRQDPAVQWDTLFSAMFAFTSVFVAIQAREFVNSDLWMQIKAWIQANWIVQFLAKVLTGGGAFGGEIFNPQPHVSELKKIKSDGEDLLARLTSEMDDIEPNVDAAEANTQTAESHHQFIDSTTPGISFQGIIDTAESAITKLSQAEGALTSARSDRKGLAADIDKQESTVAGLLQNINDAQSELSDLDSRLSTFENEEQHFEQRKEQDQEHWFPQHRPPISGGYAGALEDREKVHEDDVKSCSNFFSEMKNRRKAFLGTVSARLFLASAPSTAVSACASLGQWAKAQTCG